MYIDHLTLKGVKWVRETVKIQVRTGARIMGIKRKGQRFKNYSEGMISGTF